MRMVLFEIGPLKVYSYGAMIAAGILAGYAVSDRQAKRRGLDRDALLSLVILCAAGGLAGAKLLFWIISWRQILADSRELLHLSDGFVVYGGILMGLLCGWLYAGKRRIDFLTYADVVLPSVALAQGFGRIGCFLAGCCYGLPYDGPFSVTFRDSLFAPNGVPLVPAQLLAAGLDLLHFSVLTLLLRRNVRRGKVCFCYLLCYSIGRFGLEFLRGDLIRGQVGVLSTSQFLSLFLCAAAVVGLARNSGGDYNRRKSIEQSRRK